MTRSKLKADEDVINMAKYKTKDEILKDIADTNRRLIRGEIKPRQGKRLIEMARRRLDEMKGVAI
jgi:hypothetical protein